MKTADALIKIFRSTNPNDLIILSDGKISTEALYLNESQNHFYMLGSMGQASMIGLGVAIGRPDRRCIVIEGDGNLLMNPASMIVVGQCKPKNLFHIIIDNGVYETTGSQETITWNMTSIAKQCGYNSIDEIDLKKDTENLNVYFDKIGPIFLRIKVEPGSLPNVPSFNKAPLKIIEDFKNQL